MTETRYCTVEQIKNELKKYTIIDSSSIEFLGEHCTEKYRGCTLIHGNFEEWSHGFEIITDDKVLIAEFQKLFEENRKRKE